MCLTESFGYSAEFTYIVHKINLCWDFLMSNSYFGHGMTLYATNSVMAQTSTWLVYSHHSKLLFFVFSKLHPSTSLCIFYCLLILCSRNTKHHNRQRLVLGPDSLLNVYSSISYWNNTVDYYIKDIWQIHWLDQQSSNQE